ncbi:hypothetical protein [Dyadobacter sp. LHD-138]|nr:hypothetical protein [Dyadobacter sp. LHD-138]MDQ6482476.1 hypothetical protein [Dyadobacter sp. LHD-138]
MPNENAYNDGYSYETFIRRAFKNVTSEGKNGEHSIQMTTDQAEKLGGMK